MILGVSFSIKINLDDWKNYMKPIYLLIILGLPFHLLSKDTLRIDGNNWMNHPKITEIRNEVNRIENSIKKGTAKEDKKEFDYCIPYKDTERKVTKDKKGRILKYTKACGSDDSAMKWSFYYDTTGHLIFLFIEAGAVNGAEFEGRLYFSTEKTRLWEKYGYKTDQEYTFQYPMEDKELVFNPDSAFVSKVECK
jgi:hypothetical protein